MTDSSKPNTPEPPQTSDTEAVTPAAGTPPPVTLEDAARWIVESRRDDFLQRLVRMANEADREGAGWLTITLQVAGVLVSGHLSSGYAYFASMRDEMTDLYRQHHQEEDPEGTAKAEQAFATFFGQYEGRYPEPDKADDRPLPGYIHIQGAQFFTPDGRRLNASRTWWRGRIDAVDGFFLGRMDQAGVADY